MVVKLKNRNRDCGEESFSFSRASHGRRRHGGRQCRASWFLSLRDMDYTYACWCSSTVSSLVFRGCKERSLDTFCGRSFNFFGSRKSEAEYEYRAVGVRYLDRISRGCKLSWLRIPVYVSVAGPLIPIAFGFSKLLLLWHKCSLPYAQCRNMKEDREPRHRSPLGLVGRPTRATPLADSQCSCRWQLN